MGCRAWTLVAVEEERWWGVVVLMRLAEEIRTKRMMMTMLDSLGQTWTCLGRMQALWKWDLLRPP